MSIDRAVSRVLSRRGALRLALGATVSAVIAACSKAVPPGATPTTAPSNAATASAVPSARVTSATPPACVVTPAETEGPYFVDERLLRSDIRSDPSNGSVRPGVPLALALNVYRIDGTSCAPLADAHVDVWHCDASGVYSDESANNSAGQKFLRGYQISDAKGAIAFTTIYPGWYQGRAVHIHFKIRTHSGSTKSHEFTSQFFFDESVTDEVHANAPYNARGSRDTRNSGDNVYSTGGDQLLLALSKSGTGYRGTFDIGLKIA